MEHLPPWLRNVPLPPPPAGDDETPAWLRGIDSLAPPTPPAATNPPDWLNTEESVSDAAGVPDWLADLQSEVSDPLAAATPAAPWLEGVQPEPPAERPSTFGATGWLSGLGGEPQSGVDPAPEPPPTTSSRIRMPVGPTDWLRSMGHEEATDEPPAPERPESAPADIDSGVPDWLRELSEEEIDEITETFTEPPASPALPAATPKPVSPPESTFADWLDEVLELPSPDRPTVVSANDETVLASEVPEWLTSDQPALPPEPSAVDLPAWLQNIAGDEPPAAPGSVRLDLPSWLLDDNLIVQPPTTTTPPIAPDAPTLLADSSVRDRSEQQSDPLAWLAGEPEQLQPEEAAPPDWLQEVEQQIVAEPSAPAAAEAEIPTWLREADASAVSDWADEPPAPPAASAAPDWLREEAPAASDVPDWLREEAPAASAAPDWLREEASAASAAPDWLREEAPAASDAPDWLREEAPAASDAPDWLREEAPAVSDVPDWLREEAPAASAAPDWLREEAPAASDVPDWLREEALTAPSAPAEAEIPTWLREADASAVSDWADEPPAPSAAASDAPAWLREEAPAAASAAPDWLREEAPTASDVPAWLREEAPAAASAAPDWLQEEAPAASDAPDWLREEAPAASDAPDWLREEAPAAAGDVPAWLREETPAASDVPAWLREEAPAVSDVPAWLREEAPAASDVPDWLREEAPAASDVPAWLREEAPAAASAAPDWLREEAPTASDVPAWLREEAPAVSDVPAWLREEAPAVSDVPALRGEMPARVEVTGDTPDWLAADISANDLSWLAAESSEPAHADVAPTTSSASDEFFSGADLPPWLRASTERVAETPVAPSITWLQQLSRKEIEEEEAHAVSDVVVVKPPLPAPVPRRAEDLAAMALLERLVQTPLPVSVPTEQPVSTRRRLPVLEQWLALALIVAALVGVIAPGLVTPLVSQVQPSPAAIALSEQLIDLGSDDVVLVAYEWGAQRVAELRPLEQALLNELTADRVKLIIVSTDLQGTLLSFDLIGPLRAAGYNNENGVTFGGRDYVLLGYRPGGELALRSMAIDLRAQLRRDYTGQDATAGLLATLPDGTPRIQTLNDLGMIVVLADEVQDVQIWMEQIHSAAPEVPIAFLMPQEVYPQALPYLRLPNVYAIAGQRGASDLMAAGRADDNAVAMLAYQTWATIVFVAVLVVGGLIVIVGRLRRSTRGAV